ncbi:Uma2 family endonuclease [Nodosilinea sp. LEGE 07088]|uniref:Uma2 family endonuclease n=1 Tax=Nodosilinea sp. LEGE 07088 TaxID=2777968 RepID=UPI0034D95EBA
MMEYANTSLEKDLELKDKISAQAGIAEYWVVNLKTRDLIVFRNPFEGEYQATSTLSDGTLYSESFPTVALEVAQLVLEG